MAVVLLAILFIGLLLIATEAFNRINKAAVAMFAGVSCWILYIAYGTDFVVSEHPMEFLSFLSSHPISVNSVKVFIAEHVFLRYVAQAANIVLFLLATATIVEVLSNNGCFDFATEWLRTRKPKKLLWKLALLTFLLSANLDNLVTVVLLISIVHPLLQNDRLRRIYCTVIVLAANCGGAITVIGDMTSLKLWTDRLVSPTDFFLAQALPVVVGLCVMLLLMHRSLPRRIEFTTTTPRYRGDDTLLTRPQRLLLFFVGIGGLWFIPTFHRITQMPPFVGALCVLALLWIVNELCNRSLLGSDQMVRRRLPLALQYANLQNVLFFVGLTLMFGALCETGLPGTLVAWMNAHETNVYAVGACSAALAGLMGSVPALVGMADMLGHPETVWATGMDAYAASGIFWPLLSYATAFGGSLLATGTIAGFLLMRMEEVTFGWYLRHITPKVLAGFAAGCGVWLVYALMA
ncbi:MAG: SLC13 family permease [Alloprevotella sp.]|nr:SLC13 family permease [Alloprevotella sp.]